MTTQKRNMSIEDLANEAGVPVRTVRYYVTEGLLPRSTGRGRNAVYGEEHSQRLKLIRLLVARHVPLVEIRVQIARLSPSEVRFLLKKESHRVVEEEQAARMDSPRHYVSGVMRRARVGRLAEESEFYEEPEQFYTAWSELPPASGEDLGRTERVSEMSEELLSARPVGALPPTESWRRIELFRGVELHVREDALPSQQALVDRIVDTARRFSRQDEEEWKGSWPNR